VSAEHVRKSIIEIASRDINRISVDSDADHDQDVRYWRPIETQTQCKTCIAFSRLLACHGVQHYFIGSNMPVTGRWRVPSWNLHSCVRRYKLGDIGSLAHDVVGTRHDVAGPSRHKTRHREQAHWSVLFTTHSQLFSEIFVFNSKSRSSNDTFPDVLFTVLSVTHSC